jgi:predicted amidohydrolase YtcJ
MKELGAFILISFFIFALACQSKSQKGKADIALIKGKIWTVNPGQPWAEAVAIKGEKILEVGSSRKIMKLISGETRVIDLKGSLVLPGFIDSHTHFLDGGFSLLSIQLRDVKTREEFAARIMEKAKDIGEGGWILNGDWDHEQFDPPQLPNKEWIDEVTPRNPVCVNRLDGHMVLSNSLALRIAGISKETPSPEGGEILKDLRTGEPTGILKDAAMDLVMRHIPEPTFRERLRAAELALRHAAKKGVTSVHDMGPVSNLEVYAALLKDSKITARLTVYIPITEAEALPGLESKIAADKNLLRIGGLKGFVDGSLGSSTALFFEPYEDDTQKKELLHSQMFPEGIMERRIQAADRANLQVAIHAIGDRANNILLDIFERVMSQGEKRERRWRVEHAQHLLASDIERMARLRLIASVQPYHAIDDGRWAERKIGRQRCRLSYAYRSLLDKGVRLAAGSDWTVAPLDPLSGIYAFVTRRTIDGKNPGGWFPEQKISLEQAIKAYTLDGAYADFSEKAKGSVERGKLADLVVLSRNIFEIPAEEIIKAKVIMTIFNGKVIHRK